MDVSSLLADLVPIAATGAFAAVGWLAKQGAGLIQEKTQSSQAARLVDTLGSVATGIAHTLAVNPPTEGGTLDAVRNAAIAQGVAYAKTALPDTIQALGVTDATLATRLGNEVAGLLLAVIPGASAIAAAVPLVEEGANALASVASAVSAAAPAPAAAA